jgi:hypothetical protein
MTDYYYNNEEDKLSSDTNSRTSGTLEYCEFCGAPIVLKLRELWEKQNPHDWLSWKRVLIERWWQAFDADDPKRNHKCKQQKQKNLEQWVEV